jgi:hypothetical protein
LRSGIISKTVAKNVLEFLAISGIGSNLPTGIKFSESDRLKAALMFLKMGCDEENISKMLNWKDFELLSSELLRTVGYVTKTNIYFTKPRMEIDVIGIKSGFAIIADCKHWKYNSISSTSRCARKQAQRTEFLLRRVNDISSAVPIILTLHDVNINFIEGIPIVPISKFKSFINDVHCYFDEILVIFNNQEK